MIKRVAVVNRGEAALRFLQSARIANPIIEPVLLYTQADQENAAVRRYPESILLAGDRYSYENATMIIEAARCKQCDAVWLGWGFASEKADFVDQLETSGLVVLAPTAQTLSLLGDKAHALQAAYHAGFNQSNNFILEYESSTERDTHFVADAMPELLEQFTNNLSIKAIKFPLLMKASEGGGGRGIFQVDNAEEKTIETVIRQALNFVQRMQMSCRFVVEEWITRARHIEAQILGDGQGAVCVVGLRDCSVQRRKQKLIEECPPYQLRESARSRMIHLAKTLAQQVNYRSAGTIEMLYQPESDRIHFLEVNPRLQVEHCVSEMVYGIDLVLAQIQIARDRTLPKIQAATGVAIEARIYAEDPLNDFIPSPGRLSRFRIAHQSHVRIDTGFEEGDLISEDFDPLIAKVIAWGPDRRTAIQRLQYTLMDSQILIEGGSANHHYLSQLLKNEDYQQGLWDIQKIWRDHHPPAQYLKIAIIASAIDQFLQKDDLIQNDQNRHRQEGEVPLWVYRLHTQTFFICEEAGIQKDVQKGIVVDYHYIDAYTRLLKIQGQLYKVQRVYGDRRYWVQGFPYLLSSRVAGPLCAPSMGIVLSHEIQVGDQVEKGQILLLLESMKVELRVEAPESGWVRSIYANIGDIVRPGQALLLLDSEIQDDTPTSIQVIQDSITQPDHMYQVMKAAMSAWDISPCCFYFDMRQVQQISKDKRLEIITLFLNLAHLFDRRPRQYSEEKFGYSYVTRPLLLLDTLQRGDAEAVPENWRKLLQKVLLHLDTHTLKPSQELTKSLVRLRRVQSKLKDLQSIACLLLEGIEDIPLVLLDRIASLDPDRFPDLIALADAQQYKSFANYQTQQLSLKEQTSLLTHLSAWIDDKEMVEGYIRKMRMSPNRMLYVMAQHALYMHSYVSNSTSHIEIDVLDECANLIENQIHLNQILSCLCVCLELHYHTDILHREILSHDEITQVYNKEGEVYLAYILLGHEILIITSQGCIYLSDRLMPTQMCVDHYVAIQSVYQNSSSSYPFIHLLYTYQKADHRIIHTLETSISETFTPAYIQQASRHDLPCNYTHIQLCSHNHLITHYTLLFDADTQSLTVDHSPLVNHLLPASVKRLQLNRWSRFDIEKITDPHARNIHIYHLKAKENPEDVRLIAYGEVTHLRRRRGKPLTIPQVDQVFYEALRTLHRSLKTMNLYGTLHWNRLILRILPVIPLGVDVIKKYVSRLSPAARWVGLEKVVVQARFVDPQASDGISPLMDLSIYNLLQKEQGYALRLSSTQALMPRSLFESRVVAARRRGLIHPREIINLLEGVGPITRGTFTLYEYDQHIGRLQSIRDDISIHEEWSHVSNLDWADQQRQIEQHRSFDIGKNISEYQPIINHAKIQTKTKRKVAVVIGLIETPLLRPRVHLKRVVIISDPTIRMGALAEAECQSIIAAFDLASELQVPVEWVSVSSGARIDWETGTENLDACARVLKRIISFTKSGGMVNVIVPGICVGAQSYWNAEATMMTHCNGVLIMTDQGSMVLTGKKALEFSGCVSAQDELDLGGYTSVMGPNGQAQMYASDLPSAYRLLYRFYQLCYTESGKTRPVRMKVKDRSTRNIADYPYPSDLQHGFTHIAEIFSAQNQDRKRPFSVRPIMQALLDQDVPSLERWSALQGGETAVVWHGRLDGYAVTVIGIENQPVQRVGMVEEGPTQWAGGTLYPQASRKVARAIRASQSRMPVIVLANLSGFDGSPESLRQWQLEYGSEIAQSVENFDAPIYFVVLSRYHGGAYVVFSKSLNPRLEAMALHGSFASVIGGAPAAAVIFGREVKALTQKYGGDAQGRARALAEVAQKFDQIHDVHRALSVGSIDALITLEELRTTLAQKLALDHQKYYSKHES